MVFGSSQSWEREALLLGIEKGKEGKKRGKKWTDYSVFLRAIYKYSLIIFFDDFVSKASCTVKLSIILHCHGLKLIKKEYAC